MDKRAMLAGMLGVTLSAAVGVWSPAGAAVGATKVHAIGDVY